MKDRAALIVGVSIPDDAPDELKSALARRNKANRTGRCTCGATFRIAVKGNAVMTHADGCTATDEAIAEISKRTGWAK
jgi:hypothetical protein